MAKLTWGIGVKIRKGLRIVQRGDLWYREERIGGRPVRRSLETTDEKEAMRRAVAGLEEPARPFLSSKAMTPPTLTLGKALEEYEDWYAKNLREDEGERVAALLRIFIDTVGDDFDTKAVTRDHVQRFVDSRKDGRTPMTVRKDFARLRAFLNWLAKRKDAVNPNCWRGIDKPKDDGLTKEAPSTEKVRAVLGKLRSHPWLGEFCTVLAETGMRPSELLGLRGVDLRGKLCSIVPWEGRQLKSKWSKRVIELNETAAAILKARVDTMFDKARPIFATKTGEVYVENSVYRFLCDALAGERRAAVPEAVKITLYDFRHFFCSEHAAPGPQHMELEALAAYIGHSPASTTTLLRWYADARALRRGAPASLVGEPKAGRVIGMKG